MEILKYTLPSLVVLLAVWVVLYKMLKEDKERRAFELKKQDRSLTIPIRLRGYERLILMLERIEIEHILLDADISSMSVVELQQFMLTTIRREADHNLSQQIYVSDEVWAAVVIAKEETLRFVSDCASRMAQGSTALQYAQLMIEAYTLNGETPLQQAKTRLKQEARELY